MPDGSPAARLRLFLAGSCYDTPARGAVPADGENCRWSAAHGGAPCGQAHLSTNRAAEPSVKGAAVIGIWSDRLALIAERKVHDAIFATRHATPLGGAATQHRPVRRSACQHGPPTHTCHSRAARLAWVAAAERRAGVGAPSCRPNVRPDGRQYYAGRRHQERRPSVGRRAPQAINEANVGRPGNAARPPAPTGSPVPPN
jgi:hypothetical protein